MPGLEKIGDFWRECNSYRRPASRYRDRESRIWDNGGHFLPRNTSPRGEGPIKASWHGRCCIVSRQRLIIPTDLKSKRKTLPDEIDKGLKLKKQESVKMARKKRVLLRSYLNQPLEELRNSHARHEIGMGIFWVVLAVVCGGLGWVLLTILLK